MRQLIIFSGLGADHTVFSKLHFSGFEVHHVAWIEPMKGEALRDYMGRMNIPETGNDTVVMGLSFGGVLAMELAVMRNLEKVILLSSVYSQNYLPRYLQMIRILKINHWFPLKLVRRPTQMAYWFFGLENAEDKNLLKHLIGRTGENYFIWATDCIMNYQGNHLDPGKIIHIHGDNDRVLPLGKMKCDYVIKGGGHFIVLTHYREMQQILDTILEIKN